MRDIIQENIKGDFGYSNAFWFKISDQKVLGFGELEGMIGTPEEIEAWCFNEFSKEASQLGTQVKNFRIGSRIKLLKNLQKNVAKQIDVLESQNQIIPRGDNERFNQTNHKNKESNKSKSHRTPR